MFYSYYPFLFIKLSNYERKEKRIFRITEQCNIEDFRLSFSLGELKWEEWKFYEKFCLLKKVVIGWGVYLFCVEFWVRFMGIWWFLRNFNAILKDFVFWIYPRSFKTVGCGFLCKFYSKVSDQISSNQFASGYAYKIP